MTGHDDIFKDVTIKGLLERIEKDDNPEIVHKPNVEHPENYIILPGKKHGSYEYPNLLVSKTVEYKGLNWGQCEEKLHQEDSFMLTIRQFADFLKLLKDEDKVYNGMGFRLDSAQTLQIYKEITEVKKPYRAEWLDVKFSKQGNDFYINYHILRNNVLNPITEKLEDCIMTDKQIDLDDYLAKANSQGLPIKATKSGSLYYWAPIDGRVAGFRAYSVWAVLDCGGGPASTYAGLGVRRARILGK